MSEATVESSITPIENILLKIVLAFRILGWVWLLLLVVAALLTDPGANRAVVISMAAGSFAWTIFTVWMARDQQRIKSIPFVIADGILVVVVANASYWAGATSLLHGGFPISWLAVVAYATNVRWTLSAAAVLFFNQWIGMELEGSRNTADQVGAIVFFVYGGIVGYGFDLIRDRDRLRRAANKRLATERRRQIRRGEQLALADQLHDSVLQTLHAIRVSSDNPEQVSYIARRQERGLRRTIHSLRSEHENPFATAMFTARDDVEDLYGIEIDMVCSYDAEMTVSLAGLVEATKEAMINAAKHSGSDIVLVYCSLEPDGLSVFVRDKGKGFDFEGSTGSFGIENSIVGRLASIGGTASIQSTPEFGTEVEMTVPKGVESNGVDFPRG
ncbi:MAG: ATP-binding protein [Actinomycetota bacterium]